MRGGYCIGLVNINFNALYWSRDCGGREFMISKLILGLVGGVSGFEAEQLVDLGEGGAEDCGFRVGEGGGGCG